MEIAFTPEQVRSWLNPEETPRDWAVTVVGSNGLIIARNRQHDDYVGRGTARDTARAGHRDDGGLAR